MLGFIIQQFHLLYLWLSSFKLIMYNFCLFLICISFLMLNNLVIQRENILCKIETNSNINSLIKSNTAHVSPTKGFLHRSSTFTRSLICRSWRNKDLYKFLQYFILQSTISFNTFFAFSTFAFLWNICFWPPHDLKIPFFHQIKVYLKVERKTPVKQF